MQQATLVPLYTSLRQNEPPVCPLQLQHAQIQLAVTTPSYQFTQSTHPPKSNTHLCDTLTAVTPQECACRWALGMAHSSRPGAGVPRAWQRSVPSAQPLMTWSLDSATHCAAPALVLRMRVSGADVCMHRVMETYRG